MNCITLWFQIVNSNARSTLTIHWGLEDRWRWPLPFSFVSCGVGRPSPSNLLVWKISWLFELPSLPVMLNTMLKNLWPFSSTDCTRSFLFYNYNNLIFIGHQSVFLSRRNLGFESGQVQAFDFTGGIGWTPRWRSGRRSLAPLQNAQRLDYCRFIPGTVPIHSHLSHLWQGNDSDHFWPYQLSV